MKKGKVVLLTGTKRAGKTTTAVRLSVLHNYNYLEFDHLLDALDNVIDGNKKEKEFAFFEQTLNFALEDAENHGINSVLVAWDFKPAQLNKLKNKDKIKIYCLLPKDINREILEDTLIKYSKFYDWPTTASQEDIERNIKCILEERDFLLTECAKYNIEVVDTSFYKGRDLKINELVEKIISK